MPPKKRPTRQETTKSKKYKLLRMEETVNQDQLEDPLEINQEEKLPPKTPILKMSVATPEANCFQDENKSVDLAKESVPFQNTETKEETIFIKEERCDDLDLILQSVLANESTDVQNAEIKEEIIIKEESGDDVELILEKEESKLLNIVDETQNKSNKKAPIFSSDNIRRTYSSPNNKNSNIDTRRTYSNPKNKLSHVYQKMEWTDEEILGLIAVYKSYPVLWNPGDTNHYKKNIRSDAWRQIAIKTRRPEEECQKKMISLSASYRREKSRVNKSTGAGEGTSKVYNSRWFAYEAFRFLKDRDNFRSKMDTNPPMVNEESHTQENIIETDIQGENGMEVSSDFTAPSPPKRTRKQIQQSEGTAMLANAVAILQTTAERLNNTSVQNCEVKSFCDFLASKILTYRPATRQGIQHAIYEILMKADRGQFEIQTIDGPQFDRPNYSMPSYFQPHRHSRSHYNSASQLPHFPNKNVNINRFLPESPNLQHPIPILSNPSTITQDLLVPSGLISSPQSTSVSSPTFSSQYSSDDDLNDCI